MSISDSVALVSFTGFLLKKDAKSISSISSGSGAVAVYIVMGSAPSATQTGITLFCSLYHLKW